MWKWSLPASGVVAMAAVVHGCVGDDPSVPSPPIDAGAPVSDDATTGPGADVAPTPATDAGLDAAAFDPSYFGHLELWMRAYEGADAGASGHVTTWTDGSPERRKVAVPANDPTCQKGPTFVAKGIHGVPVLQFDGLTECMTVGGAFRDFTMGLTVFAVFEPGNCNSMYLGNASALFESYSGSLGNRIAVERNTAPPQNASGDALLASVGKVAILGSSSWVPNKAERLAFRLPAAAGGTLVVGAAYVDGAFVASTPNAPDVPDVISRTMTHIGFGMAGYVAGGSALYCGSLGEILLYSKALSDTERGAVDAYLASRWQL